MINTLNIGKYIYQKLNNSDEITCKIYPIVADNDAKFPFIIYKRVNLYSSDAKDGIFEDDATIEVDIITDKYSLGVEIANNVRKLLEVSEVEYEDILISDARLTLATEEYNDGYIQRMQFNFKINRL